MGIEASYINAIVICHNPNPELVTRLDLERDFY